jgi:hypothetical protein
MSEHSKQIIQAINDVNINVLYLYKKKSILYNYEQIISHAIHNIHSIQWKLNQDKFISMIKYICRTFPNIVLHNDLLIYACNNFFLEFAKLIFIINKRNNVDITYDLNACFYNAISKYFINKDIIKWIISLNIDNIFNINYVNSVAKALYNYPEKYLHIITILKDCSIDIDNVKLFNDIYKINSYHNKNQLEALSNIAHNNKFDNSVYINCYLYSISIYSIELYEWCIKYFICNNYDYNNIDIGNKNKLFVNICSNFPQFACIFAKYYEIDISYDEYIAFYKICFYDRHIIKWALENYNIPDDILIIGFKFLIIHSKYELNYKYIYKCIQDRNITNVFDSFDDIIHILTQNNFPVLYWICKQTDKYIMFFNKDIKKHEIIKNNGIFNIISDLDLYSKSDQIYDCDVCMDDRKYFVKLECNHIYCNECTIKLYKCPLCLKIINNNVTLLKIEI